MSPRRRHLASLALSFTAALAALPALAANDRIDVEGGYAFAGEPIHVIVNGGPLDSLPPAGEAQERRYLWPEADYSHSSVRVTLYGYEQQVVDEYLYAIEIWPRPVGTYEMRLKYRQYHPGNQAFELATGRLDVFPPVEVDFGPGAIFQQGEEVEVGFSALRACPTFPAPGTPLERRGDSFRLAVGDPRCATDVAPSIHTHQATLPADLEPGTYHLDIVTAGAGIRLSRKQFTVAAGAPWRVGEDGRFEVEVLRRDGQGVVDRARPVFVPDQPNGEWQSSLLFTFFTEDNWELMLKVLDGCAINGHFWVFAAAASDVEYEITVRDRASDTTRTYRHEAGEPTPALTDTGAFACN